MVETEVPKRVVVVLLVLALIVTFIGMVTFLQVYNSATPIAPEQHSGASQGTVELKILPPGTVATDWKSTAQASIGISILPPVSG